jgi:hypothetical protein
MELFLPRRSLEQKKLEAAVEQNQRRLDENIAVAVEEVTTAYPECRTYCSTICVTASPTFSKLYFAALP